MLASRKTAADPDESPKRGQVRRQAGQQLTGRPTVVERHGQTLHVGEQVAAQIGLDAESRNRHGPSPGEEQPGLGDAEHQRQPGQRPQPGGVVVPDRAVDDAADHQRNQ